jgi:hypothetical protein
MAGRTKFADLVIVVPGILGSRLLHHGAPLWDDGSPSFLEWVRTHSHDLAHLTVGADDPSLEELGDGVVSDGLIDGPFVAGRFVKLGGYGELGRMLQKRFGLRLGENLQLFAYDWRRDLRVAARRLAVKAEGWIQAWRAHSQNPDAKIVLVCHAMGGLVGRAFVDLEGGWPATRTIVTIGTPFQGSIAALDLLYFGLDFQRYELPLHDLTPVARTLTSIYQMLPHYPAVRTFTGGRVSPFDLRIPTFENQKIDRARQFHRDLVDHHQRNRSNPGYAEMKSHSIIGIGQPTAETCRLLGNGTLEVENGGDFADADGDGIVPRFSAEAPSAMGFAGQWVYVPQSHGMLLFDPNVHQHLCAIIADNGGPLSAPLPRFTVRRTADDRIRIDPDALSISVASPFYKVGQNVEIVVCARSAGGYSPAARSINVSVRAEQIRHLGARVTAKAMRVTPDRRRPGRWTASYRAPAPGTYRVTATTTHRWLAPFRVSDLFEVDTTRAR